MQTHSQQTLDAIDKHVAEREFYNRQVDDMHQWLVDHSGKITDEHGEPVTVSWYTLARMRQVFDRFGVDGQKFPMMPLTEFEKSQLDFYTKLRELYANREIEPADNAAPSFFVIFAVLLPVVIGIVVYVVWRIVTAIHGGK